MTQVFARYAKDLLEKQTYPEVRRTPASPPEPPYDVTAWSLGMLMGADVVFAKQPVPAAADLERLAATPKLAGAVAGDGARYTFDYRGPDAALAVNRLLKAGAKVAFERGGASEAVVVTGAPRKTLDTLAADLGIRFMAVEAQRDASAKTAVPIRAPRVGLYQSWTASMDEGWTRWALEQWEFAPKTLHNADVRAGTLRQQYDVIVIADQQPRDILEGNTSRSARPEYRGGIGEEGLKALQQFVADGGTLVMLGNSTDLAIQKWPIPVRNIKRGLTRDQHFAPGTVVRVQVDTASPLGFGMPADTCGFYVNSPFFDVTDGFASQRVSVIARYPNTDIVASGWLKGEDLMAGRAAVVEVDMNPGRLVLFGLRPQFRAQTQATFPLLFDALYQSTVQ